MKGDANRFIASSTLFLFVSKIRNDKQAYNLFNEAIKLNAEPVNLMKNIHRNTVNLLKQTDQKQFIETTFSELQKECGEKGKPKIALPVTNLA